MEATQLTTIRCPIELSHFALNRPLVVILWFFHRSFVHSRRRHVRCCICDATLMWVKTQWLKLRWKVKIKN